MGPRAGLERCGKSRPPPRLDPRTVQPVASRYTDYATRPINPITNFIIYFCNINFNITLPSMTFNLSLSSAVYKRNVPPVSLTLVLHSAHLHFFAHKFYSGHVNTQGRQTL